MESRAPPLSKCLLPGPWQDSHPTFWALRPGACKRAWVAVRKVLLIFSWQVAQVSEPTNSAPGIEGGATMLRSMVAQEMKLRRAATSKSVTNQNRKDWMWNFF